MLKRNKVYVKLHNLKNIVRNNEVIKLKKKKKILLTELKCNYLFSSWQFLKQSTHPIK